MLRGKLVDWNDARGFGFIAAEDGARYFVHISAMNRSAARPRIGDTVRFRPHLGVDGRTQARAVTIEGADAPGQPVSPPAQGRSLDWRIPVALVLCILLAIAILRQGLPWQAALVYAGMGLISFLSYRRDKRSAEAGSWRTSEARLLAADLCLGIVGGLVAQALFRHKTRKPRFVLVTIFIATAHALWLASFALDLIAFSQLTAPFDL
jgi:uncharacterized membrane protein YsdA (DUF1294 family)/cold shock CspA family protein